MRTAPVILLPAGNLTTSINSNGEELSQIFLYSIQAIYTGTPVGSLKLQLSNDNVPMGINGQDPAVNVVNWTDYTGSTVAVSAAGSNMWNVSDVAYKWVRVAYTATSGTGTIKIQYFGKGG